MVTYATVEDINALARPLTAEEQDKAEQYIEIASALLRTTAKKYGKDIDQMIAADDDYSYVVKEIVVKAVCRALDSTASTTPAATQASQAALGYSMSMTYLNAGQSLYYLKNELKELGIMRQKFGALEVYGNDDDV